MKKYIKLIALVFLISCFENNTNSRNKELSNLIENNLQPIHKIEGDATWNIIDRMEFYNVPGVTIAVIKDFKIHQLLCYGVTDRVTQNPVKKTTMFRVGSISKPVSAYAALKLVEQGKLSLNTPVNNDLKSWKIPDNDFTKETPITLKNLLSHTAGINHGGGGGYESEPFPTLLEVLDGKNSATNDPLRVIEKPNVRHRYSGGGYTVMQQLMEDVVGENFNDLMKNLVFKPLEMNSSSFDVIPLPKEIDKRAATGHLDNDLAISRKTYYNIMLAAGGMWCTAEDLAKFGIDIQKTIKDNSGKVISQDMANKMSKPYLSNFYGLGIMSQKKDNEEYLYHTGAAPGYTAHMYLHKTDGYGAIVIQNAMKVRLLEEIERSIASVYQWKGFLNPSYKRFPITKLEAKSIVGRYEFGFDKIFRVFEENDKLYIQHQSDTKKELVKISDSVFIRKDRTYNYRFKTASEKECIITLESGREFSYQKLGEKEKLPSEWIEENNYGQALIAYSSLLKEQPNKKKQVSNRLISWGVDVAYKQRKYDFGIKIVELSAKLFPDSSSPWANLAWIYNESGDLKKAIHFYKKAVELNPNDNFSKQEIIRLEKQSKTN